VTTSSPLSVIETIAATEVGRGSSLLAPTVAGSLGRAASSLLAQSGLDAWIFTGFYLPRATPPTAETDGPVGAVQIAAAVEALGGRATIVTDQPCGAVLRAAMDAAGVAAGLSVAPVGEGFEQWLSSARDSASATHVIAIERVGVAADGIPRNMRGQDISGHTAPLERLYSAINATRIAIGDGGNEIGMGVLDAELVARVVSQGELVHCATGCDELIVAGTSNWGAQALVAALALGSPSSSLTALLAPSWNAFVLDAIVAAGAADGVTLESRASVDGLTTEAYEAVLRSIADIALATPEHKEWTS